MSVEELVSDLGGGSDHDRAVVAGAGFEHRAVDDEPPGEGDRANPATDLRAFTTGNMVRPFVDGCSYFARLCAELQATQAGDQVPWVRDRGGARTGRAP